MTDPTSTPTPAPSAPPPTGPPTDAPKKTKRKRRRQSNSDNQQQQQQQQQQNPKPPYTTFTIRHPQWSYLHLQLYPAPPLDILTVRTHLTSALSRFLGLTGTAIPIDILKVSDDNNNNNNDNRNKKRECWIRVPTDDLPAVMAAVGGWIGREGEGQGAGGEIGWRVLGKARWLGQLIAEEGERGVWED
ncbi:MAG: hypothetical protein M1816_003206 [Peltula sp. TS41687]|nr:MAG: hypothetical protein M1816_003206 [Peltula sp. TS41687]